MRLDRSVGVMVVLATLLLGGCTRGEPVPSQLVTQSPSASVARTTPGVPTLPPWPVRPQYPQAARQPDIAGARAAFDYFLVGIGFGFRTGNPSVVQEVSGPKCSYCSSLEALIKSLDKDDRVFVDADPYLDGVKDISTKTKEIVALTAVVKQRKSVLLTREGELLARNPPSASTLRVSLLWARDRWIVFTVNVVATS